MWLNLKKILFGFVVLQISGEFVKVESKAIKKSGKGKAKAFGAGLLVGGFAVAASQAFSPKQIHYHQHVVAANPNFSNPVNVNAIPTPSKPITTIERGETLPNGCYKQTIKEPIPNDPTRFTETEQLICPPTTENKQTFVHMPPAVAISQPAPVVPAVHMIQVPVNIEQKTDAPPTPAPAPAHVAPLQPLQPNYPTSGQTTVNNAIPVPAVPAVYPVQPVSPPISVVAAPPQVIVLSKTTGSYGENKNKKKNAANCLFESNHFAVISSMFLVLRLF